MRVGERHFSFSVSDKIGEGLISLAYYTAEEVNGDILSEIFSLHPELHSSFSEVQVGYDYPGSVLVPAAHYSNGQEKTLLNSIHGSTVQTTILSETLADGHIVNIYSVPQDVFEWVGRIFPAYRYRHNYTLGMNQGNGTESDRIIVDLDTDECSCLLIHNNRLCLAQTLGYTTHEDILYFLLKACNQFSLSREEVELHISGLIMKESQLYRELYQYFLKTHFRDSGWHQEELKDYPPHFFTLLNDLSRCAS